MDKSDSIVITWLVLIMITVSCVMNDPCDERNPPQSAAEAELCK